MVRVRAKKAKIFTVMTLIVVSCLPETTPEVPQSTTSTQTTTTVRSTTTTLPVGSCTPVPSGGDDTAMLTSTLNTCSTVVINRLFRVDKQITVTASNKTITWSGLGKFYRSVSAPDGSGLVVLRFDGASNITLNNPQIQGPNPRQVYTPGSLAVCGYRTPLENQHLLGLRHVNNFTTNGGKLWDGDGDGVYIDGGSNGITLNDLTVDCVGRTAVTNLGSTNTRINGGLFTTTVWWIFNIELQGGIVDNYYVDKPSIGYSRMVFLLASCPYGGSYSNVTINKPILLPGSRQDYTARCGPVTVNY